MRPALFTAFVFTLTITACAPFKMAVHEDLQPAYDDYTVKGRQGILIKQKMSFGEFATDKVQRSWTKGNSSRSGLGYIDPNRQEWVNIIGTEYINRKQTVRYSLNNGGLQSDVYCVSRFNAKDFNIGRSENSVLNIGLDLLGAGGKSSSLYYVQIYTSSTDDRPWELALDNQESQGRPNKYVGYLAKSRNEYYTLHPVSKVEMKGKTGNTLMGAVGFEFRNKEGKTLAAVSLIDNGRIYLGKTTAEERFLLANACTALLLQEQIG
jgi:hypothetical protein